MFELLKNILIAVGVLIGFWIVVAIVMGIHASNNETYAGATSLTDDSLEKKYRKLLKMFGCDGLITTNKTVPNVHIGEVRRRLLWFARTETVHDYLDEVEKNGSKKGYRIVYENCKWYLQGMIITKDGEDIKVEYSLFKMYLPNKFQTYFSAYDLDDIIAKYSNEFWEENDQLKIKAEKERQAKEAEEKQRQQAIEETREFFRNEKPEQKELRIASYFDCKGVIRTLEDLEAIKDPQDGDKYLFFNQDDTVDNYMYDPRNLGIRIGYDSGNWYVNFLRIDISDYDEVSVEIKYFVIGGCGAKIDIDYIKNSEIDLQAYIAFKYLDAAPVVNAYIMDVYDDFMTQHRRIGAR